MPERMAAIHPPREDGSGAASATAFAGASLTAREIGSNRSYIGHIAAAISAMIASQPFAHGVGVPILQFADTPSGLSMRNGRGIRHWHGPTRLARNASLSSL